MAHHGRAFDIRGLSLVTGGFKSRPNPIAKRRKPLDRLVAENESHMTVSDLAAPATHRSGGHLLLEKAPGDLGAVEAEGCHVKEE